MVKGIKIQFGKKKKADANKKKKRKWDQMEEE
jgi:hypothetical protein